MIFSSVYRTFHIFFLHQCWSSFKKSISIFCFWKWNITVVVSQKCSISRKHFSTTLWCCWQLRKFIILFFSSADYKAMQLQSLMWQLYLSNESEMMKCMINDSQLHSSCERKHWWTYNKRWWTSFMQIFNVLIFF